jgi:hypothetical protein
VKAQAFQDKKTKGKELDSSFRWNDKLEQCHWISAFAGMTSKKC